ncbi:E3 ubiquitin-protein ligase CHIP-like isoform X2 [Nicotiana tabacum]|uniref:E3 ubiquitin-protein ligase CHIP-like isoform X2 n=2 Tax=Nicotiana TaxID=4085 RepID=A0AC58TVP1_TOBAC|nr:PREDICTED: E3 ubiquitin-protein ligase CHIP-like isoform X2 [Nicotiana sylvestris]
MSPIVAPSAAAKQAEQLKQDGNNYFQKNRFAAAIDAYTEAITLCPNVPIYWTNRALCHRKRNEWTRVEEDCREAIQLDHTSVKALDLGRGANPNSYMVEEIWQELAKAKYLEWEHESSRRTWELKKLKETCESALKERHGHDSSQIEGFIDRSTSLLKQLDALGRVFRKAAEDDTPTEVPDYLCCKITLDIFRDPVITPSGVTYERAVILDHLEKVGKFDPVTREPLKPSQLVPNLAIKEAVHAFLDKHGWAYRMG